MDFHDPLWLMCGSACLGVFGFVFFCVVTLLRGRPGKP
jgi:hypothetical protein